MSLVSPGVQVTVDDQSQYVTTTASSVPLIIVASAQDKQSGTSTSVASATTSANAGKLYQVTSQRDLLTLYGTPTFYQTTDGTPIHGYELNEYGLQAAYSTLGVTNLAYILRADIDLANLVGTTSRPRGKYADGAIWLNPTKLGSTGVSVLQNANSATKKYVQATVQFKEYISEYSTSDGSPLWSATTGTIAVNPFQNTFAPHNSSTYWYKTDDAWVKLGSKEWQDQVPAMTTPFGISNDERTFVLMYGTGYSNITPEFSVSIIVPPQTDASGFAALINAKGIEAIRAQADGTTLNVFLKDDRAYPWFIFRSPAAPTNSLRRMAPFMQLGGTSGTGLKSIKNTQWANGTIWLDTESKLSTKLTYVLNKMVASKWVQQTVNVYNSDAEANYSLDKAFGGTSISEGSFYLRANSNDFTDTYQSSSVVPYTLYERQTAGKTVILGTDETPTIISGSQIKIAVSIPLTATMTPYYTLTLNNLTNGAAKGFAAKINAHSVLKEYISASEVNGAIQITHLTGGSIWLDDTDASGTSNGVIAGYGLDNTAYSQTGPLITYSFTNKASTTSGSGTGATFNVTRLAESYVVTVSNDGAGYAVDDDVFVAGTLLGGTTENNLSLKVVSVDGTGSITSLAIASGSPAAPKYATELSNWKQVDSLLVNNSIPYIDPTTGTLWNYSSTTEADILVNVNGTWKGYRNVYFGTDGLPELDETGNNADTPATDPNGPIFAATAPTYQTDGTDLVYGDLWIDTSDTLNYPALYRWQQDENSEDLWVKIDLTDQVNPSGILFADVRWAGSQIIDPISDPVATIKSLLTSNYKDIDAPAADLYPSGMIVWNTRRSGNNIKKFVKNYFNETDFPDITLPTVKNSWVSVSGKNSAGVAYFGRKAMRNAVVEAMRSVVNTSTEIREESIQYTLIAAPGYPELQPDLVTLNNDKGELAYIIGDTPMRLSDSATEISAWAQNKASAASTGEDGLVTLDVNLGLFYPSGITTDLLGNEIVVPASHMALRTFIRSDAMSYPWFAAAGTRRGTIDNVNNIGYLDPETGEFQVVKNRVEIRDILYTNNINPLTYLNGVGLVNYGNKNSKDTSSAWNRTNVSRLINYLRAKVELAARPFIFEPNDELTRSEVREVINSIMIDLVGKRGITDYIVQCDSANNTPERIDRNELWIDIAVIPMKAIEFIYIPIRLVNTGDI